MLAIRLSRAGAKKRPYYHIVVADSRSPRDGRFLEKIGAYNPMLPREHADRIKVNTERATYWLGVGARPSDRVARFLSNLELMKAPVRRDQTVKSAPKTKAQERAKAAAAAAGEGGSEAAAG